VYGFVLCCFGTVFSFESDPKGLDVMSLFGPAAFDSPPRHESFVGAPGSRAQGQAGGHAGCPLGAGGERSADLDEIGERLRFAGIDERARALLRECEPVVAAKLPAILDEFYRHVMAFPEVARLFPTPAVVARARQMQIAHWGLITTGMFDGSYARSVQRIGEVHCRLGVEPRWYIGGYNFIVKRLIVEVVQERARWRLLGKRYQREVAAAFSQAALLDMDLAISVYLSAARRNRRETLDGLATRFEQAVASVVHLITIAAHDVDSLSRSLADSSVETLHKADAAMACSLDATANIERVAAATDVLTESLKGVATHIAGSSNVSSRAVEEAQQISMQVGGLTQSVNRIDGIVDVIREIAGRTRLLALNATIEAARAGDASRGFSVVAGEIKTLALQTAEATAEIDAQIGSIRDSSRHVADSIGGIRQTIAEMNQIGAQIAGAIEDQREATQHTACNLQQAWLGAAEVANIVMGVTRQASDSSRASASALSATTDLARQAQEMTVQVERFLETVSAA
jgi:methyl-accepting chemotaxis protein